jgi:NADP-dependent 3-hydroxy acid dehydrogenase YdfG
MPTAPFEPHPDRRPAIVTGASSGIGAATALALAAAGHPVVLAARRTDRLAEMAAKIEADGGQAAALTLDLADPASIDAFCEQAHVLGPPEVVVSNAGEVLPYPALASDPDAFDSTVHVNLSGPQRLLAHLGPGMVERGRGDVVFVTSDVAVRPRTRMAAYVASKTGLEGLARALQMELEGTGVRVGMIRPGPSHTEQGSHWPEQAVHEIVADWARWGLFRHDGALRPEDVAAAVLAMVHTPKGAHLTLIEIQPEAPVDPDRSHR